MTAHCHSVSVTNDDGRKDGGDGLTFATTNIYSAQPLMAAGGHDGRGLTSAVGRDARPAGASACLSGDAKKRRLQ